MNVVGIVILVEPDLRLAVLRFDEQGTIHEHPGESDAIVACLEGAGFTRASGR